MLKEITINVIKSAEVAMFVIRNPEAKEKIKDAYQNGNPKKKLFTAYLPQYQTDALKLIAEHTSDSMAEVVRDMIDDMMQSLIVDDAS